MDFTNLTDAALADTTRDWLLEVERRLHALPQGDLKMLAFEHITRVHQRLERLARLLKDDSVIQPLSGGEPKPVTP